jgi:hypothetical protein
VAILVIVLVVLFIVIPLIWVAVMYLNYSGWKRLAKSVIDSNDRLLKIAEDEHTQNKKLLEIIKRHQQKKFDDLHKFIYDFFEGTTIENHVIHVTTDGNLTIKAGQGTDMLDVDMKLFSEDPIVALEQIRTQWMADH